MSTNKKWGGTVRGVVITIALLFSVISQIPNLVMAEWEARETSREAQQCDVVGSELGCIENTAYTDGSNGCSCSISIDRRITYENTYEEKCR